MFRVTQAQLSTTIDHKLRRPHCASQSNGENDGPNLEGVRGMGFEIGAGLSRTRTGSDCIVMLISMTERLLI
jgi:hypothetical protein